MAFNLDSISKDAKNNGIWEDYEESSFLIASTSSFAFQEEFTRLQKPHKRKIDKGELAPEVSLEILCKAMAKCILLDWKNVVKSDGTEVKYSTETAYRALKENDELRSFVQDVAMDISFYKAEKAEAEGKN